MKRTRTGFELLNIFSVFIHHFGTGDFQAKTLFLVVVLAAQDFPLCMKNPVFKNYVMTGFVSDRSVQHTWMLKSNGLWLGCSQVVYNLTICTVSD